MQFVPLKYIAAKTTEYAAKFECSQLLARSSLTLSIKEFADAEAVLGHVEGVVEVPHVVVRVQLVVVDEVGAVRVDERVEAQTIPPAGAEVFNVDTRVPAKQFGTLVWSVYKAAKSVHYLFVKSVPLPKLFLQLTCLSWQRGEERAW